MAETRLTPAKGKSDREFLDGDVGGDHALVDVVKKKDENEDEKKEEVKPVSVRAMFRYASWSEIALLIAGFFGAALSGAALPSFSIILGGVFDEFGPGGDVLAAGRKYALLFGYVAIGATIASFIQVAGFTIASERITLKIRKQYLQALLRQDIQFFDEGAGTLSSQIAENTVVIREAIGEKLGMLIQFATMALAGFAVGFYFSWKLTLVVISVTPLLAFGGYGLMVLLQEATSGSLGAYAAAGAIAEQAFKAIRVVTSYSLEKSMADKFRGKLAAAEASGIKKAKGQGFMMGVVMAVYFGCYGLAFWYGATLAGQEAQEAADQFPPADNYTDPIAAASCSVGATVSLEELFYLNCPINLDTVGPITFQTTGDVCSCVKCACGCSVTDNCLTGGDVLLVFFAVVIGAFAIGQAAPSISALFNGRIAARKIYDVIERKPEIDALGGGQKIEDMEGAIKFNKVTFQYPSRPDVNVIDDVSLEILPGKNTALVGGSGSGKSTLQMLTQRLYDVTDGEVTFDGVNIKDLDLQWLRANIAVVSQEPLLFATSIKQNILYGAVDGTIPTDEEVIEAAKRADAYDFIMEQGGFETFVGEKGSTFSGGQRQRLCIARALIRKPKLLILDEATSALDQTSEAEVQKALDKLLASSSFTTITIAHRLSTIRNADNIVVMGHGKILEQGTHDQLVAKGAHYSALLAAASRTKRGKRKSKRRSKRVVGDANAEELVQDDQGSDEEESDEDEVDSDEEIAEKRKSSSSFRRSRKRLSSKTSSSTSSDDKKDKKEKEKEYSVPMRRVFEYSKPEKWLYIPGLIAACVNGVQLPVFAILFSEIATVFTQPTQELIQEDANTYALLFLAFSVVVAVSNFAAFYSWGVIGERMTTRVRYALFEALLKQDMGFYDERENSVGALTAKLATDAAVVKASLADRLNLIVMNLATVISGLAIAFNAGWELTLVLIGTIPLLMFAGAMQFVAMNGVAKEDDKAIADASQVLTESIHGIRIVTAFDLGDRLVALYDKYLEKPNKLAIRKGIIGGVGFGLSQGVNFVVYSIAFWYGSKLIDEGTYDLQKLFLVFFAVVMIGVGIGQSAAMTPDVAKASQAISSVFKIIDRKTEIDPYDPSGEKIATNEDIVFKDVTFAYPTRPEVNVFKNFNLTVEGGSTVAMVGQSGSGKSTCVSLVERFYDVMEGDVTFRGIPIKKANVAWLRKQLGYIQQEPVTFDGTIFENIAMGLADEALVTQERVEEAAKLANCHEFITELPDGYQTVIGATGLSGGQRQRISIARGVIRRPKILLLDEPTASLDNVSEGVVQKALDDLAEKYASTTIIIAHRLSTIKNADKICVVHHGEIVESGTHTELLAKNGAYAKLYKTQIKKKK